MAHKVHVTPGRFSRKNSTSDYSNWEARVIDPDVTAARIDMAVDAIKNRDIRDFTVQMLKAAPDAFWKRRASSNHHPPDERLEGGNSLHTMRVIRIARLLADACDYGDLATDILISAGTIHDMYRYGPDSETEFTHPGHEMLPRASAKRNSITCNYADVIFSIAEKHSGKWGNPPAIPTLTPSDILHVADMISANADNIWELGGVETTSWIGSIPFTEQGMTKDMMDLMEALAEDSEYWQASNSFVRQISAQRLNTLTEKQRNWLDRIMDSLDEELAGNDT